MIVKFVKTAEKRRLIKDLNEIFGIGELDYTLIETGKKKIRGFSGTMTRDEIRELWEIAKVEVIGLYLVKDEAQLRLSLDGTHMLQDQIERSVIDIGDKSDLWMHGKNLESNKNNGIYAIKSGENFLGSGVVKNGKLINYIPKERRIRRS